MMGARAPSDEAGKHCIDDRFVRPLSAYSAEMKILEYSTSVDVSNRVSQVQILSATHRNRAARSWSHGT
jgi:hypothetical protein